MNASTFAYTGPVANDPAWSGLETVLHERQARIERRRHDWLEASRSPTIRENMIRALALGLSEATAHASREDASGVADRERTGFSAGFELIHSAPGY